MVTGALFIVERRPVPLGITMFVGAFNRESALFLAPLAYAVWADRWLDPRALRTVALAAGPAVVAFVTLHILVQAMVHTGLFGEAVARSQFLLDIQQVPLVGQ